MSGVTESMFRELESVAARYDSYDASSESVSIGCPCFNQCTASCSGGCDGRCGGSCEGSCDGSCYTTAR